MASPGHIVEISIKDPQGGNLKRRPVVIVYADETGYDKDDLVGVAITSQVPDELTDEWVLLPFTPSGVGVSGLKKRSAAKCDWITHFKRCEILRAIGQVQPVALRTIISKMPKHIKLQPPPG